ncbi:MAG TPA: 3-dehydroquinate synthase [Pusillimonas sp.]|nr:3-dehydroquinate synthase [Pusillimonas sp.]
MTTVQVNTPGGRYPIHIGAGRLQKLQESVPDNVTAIAIITNPTVGSLYLRDARESLERTGKHIIEITLPDGEAHKNWETLQHIFDALLENRFDRKCLLVALGGGVIGDLAGFAASIVRRGMDFVQIPTSLLAQVDSSVGGKTAIDTSRGKNLIGAFHQPRLVLADLDVLSTLPAREIRAGYAEIIKYGLLGDLDFFAWLEAHGGQVTALAPDDLALAVRRSVEMKAEIVAQDEREAGRRALLNLGHTFGHALEAECGYGEDLLHGEAVAIGMAQAFRFSASQGLCAGQDAVRAEAAIAAVGLPVRMDALPGHPFDSEKLLAHMGQDKKAEGGRLTFILNRALGEAFVARDVDPESVLQFLIAEGARSTGATA